jgi:crotonobetainyl-CoA:carnitine CoA-transferase CaiB-like acyl-CoA transferase
VWLDRGKQSIALDPDDAGDRALLERMVASADVLIQTLAPRDVSDREAGAFALCEGHPRLVTCTLSGYGEDAHGLGLKPEELLVQAESGLVSVSGAAGEWGGVGVALCDVTAGMSALIGIQQALLQRARTGRGSAVRVSLFGSAAELMSVPYLQTRYGGRAPGRVGLKNPDFAPSGAFVCADGRELVVSIQDEGDWRAFCERVLCRPALLTDARCIDKTARLAHRQFVECVVSEIFGELSGAELIDRLTEAQTAFGQINSVYELIQHANLRTRHMTVRGKDIEVPASPWETDWEPERYEGIPALDADGPSLRAEFGR